jgi:hypothetical protein
VNVIEHNVRVLFQNFQSCTDQDKIVKTRIVGKKIKKIRSWLSINSGKANQNIVGNNRVEVIVGTIVVWKCKAYSSERNQ